jgi:hypothetical protein
MFQSNSLIFPPFRFIRAFLIAICFILYYLLGWNFLSIWSLFGFFHLSYMVLILVILIFLIIFLIKLSFNWIPQYFISFS